MIDFIFSFKNKGLMSKICLDNDIIETNNQKDRFQNSSLSQPIFPRVVLGQSIKNVNAYLYHYCQIFLENALKISTRFFPDFKFFYSVIKTLI